MGSSKNFIKIFFGVCFGILVLVCGVNYVVDPLYQYRKPTFYKPYYGGNQRYKNPGFAKNFNYNSIIIGSSMTENFLISKSSEILTNPIKLSISGASAHEIFLTLNTAFERNKKIDTVLIGLDVYAVCGKIDRLRHGDNSMPLYLYDIDILNDYLYLANLDTLKESAEAIVRPAINKNDILYNYENMYQWQHLFENNFGKEKVLIQLTKEKPKSNPKDYNFENLKNSFNYNFLSIVKKHPDTNFIFFYPPYSIIAYKLWEKDGILEEVLKFKLYVFDELSKLSNAKIYDFQIASDITTYLDNYKDYTHYHQKINNWMIDQIKKDSYLLTKDNIDSHIANLRKQIADYNLSTLK